ncbi:hypothetical protein NMG60_11022453 [Bertholletia excelsa]
MGCVKQPYRTLKICCIVFAILLVTLLVAGIVVYFALLRPKQPKITVQDVTLKHIKLLNVTLGISLTIDNPNYGSFAYENSTAFVTYREELVARAPIEEDTVPARGKLGISTTVVVTGDKLINNPYFGADFRTGCLNFTSSTTLHGKAKVLKLFKIKATFYSSCNISVFVLTLNATFVCRSKVKF